jgi:hypothetical protein
VKPTISIAAAGRIERAQPGPADAAETRVLRAPEARTRGDGAAKPDTMTNATARAVDEARTRRGKERRVG